MAGWWSLLSGTLGQHQYRRASRASQAEQAAQLARYMVVCGRAVGSSAELLDMRMRARRRALRHGISRGNNGRESAPDEQCAARYKSSRRV